MTEAGRLGGPSGVTQPPPVVLVVDDQPLNRQLLRSLLEREHYCVLEAENGADAVALVTSMAVDVVLLDIMMPTLDGYQAAPQIKRQAGGAYLPIIFITALEEQQALARCLDVGGDDFMPKPFDAHILRAKLRAHLRIRQLMAQSMEQTRALSYYQRQTEREYELVEHIFANALQRKMKVPTGVDWHLSAAAMFNGDVFLSALSPNGIQYFLLGDFTGHGLVAAVGALPVARIFYTMVEKNFAVADIAREINQALEHLLPAHMFCAATLCELNASAQSATLWMGGLPDAFLLDQQGRVLQRLQSRHMALGILEDDEFERNLVHITLEDNARLLLYTDGIIEAVNEQDQQFGEQGLLNAMAASAKRNSADILAAVQAFSGGHKQTDDYSLVLIDPQPQRPIEPTIERLSQLPLSLCLALDAQQLKSLDPVPELIDQVASIPGFRAHKSALFILLSEAYNNALEHGLLALDSGLKRSDAGFIEYYARRERALAQLESGHIRLDIAYRPTQRQLQLTVTDSGPGFNHRCHRPPKQYQGYGCGIALLHELATTVSYNDKGNQVLITYTL
ncbi:fused response regulator/phosphatase [Pseudoalteromonas sp. T1lg48]|uniref:fused response regulator/phosphatase n=1 Tax=Pseudoalteromonas sp. T1lg48 TaxID=2077100 RepID=UPI001F196E35|nr:fused response regulator/phosphatase [Pseudoalteromonas sp. T1lg48]